MGQYSSHERSELIRKLNKCSLLQVKVIALILKLRLILAVNIRPEKGEVFNYVLLTSQHLLLVGFLLQFHLQMIQAIGLIKL